MRSRIRDNDWGPKKVYEKVERTCEMFWHMFHLVVQFTNGSRSPVPIGFLLPSYLINLFTILVFKTSLIVQLILSAVVSMVGLVHISQKSSLDSGNAESKTDFVELEILIVM
jgi:hypothetical protein